MNRAVESVLPGPAAAAHIAARMGSIEPFYVMDVMNRAAELEAQGRSIVHMCVGEPDFPTPRPIVEAGMRALERGKLPYTQALGLPELREAIAGFYRERYGLDVAPRRIVVTAGASAALLLAMGVLVDAGDEVLLTDPGYPCNRQFVRLMGGVPMPVPVHADTAWHLTGDAVRRHWTPRTRGALVASPANPTGTVMPWEALKDVHGEVSRRGGQLVVDEIYHGLVYGDPPASALSLSADVIVINSFSKYFHMTGWRLGWLVLPESHVRAVEKLAQNLYIAPSTPAQYAALAAFRPETIDITEQRRREFQGRRDFLVPALRDLGFGVPVMPTGAFYVYADCSMFSDDSYAFAFELLEHAGVALTPGRDFGDNAPERHLRFTYASSLQSLREGIERLRRHLATRRGG